MAVHVLACDFKEALTLPRCYRLTRREGFSRVLKHRPQVNSWFAIHSEMNLSGHARLGVSVTKRVLIASTQRNKAKRLIRECFREYARRGMSLDVIVRLRKPLDKKDLPLAKQALSELLKNVLTIK